MLVLFLKREEKVAGETKLLQALGCPCSLLCERISSGVCTGYHLWILEWWRTCSKSTKGFVPKQKGKGDRFCEDVVLVCKLKLASLDKPTLVNWLVDGELHWLENIIKKWLLCLHAAQYASLYAAARCHCTAWGHLVILPRRRSVKPPVQETRKFGRFNTWAWQCRRYPALAGHAERGRDTLWYHECKL